MRSGEEGIKSKPFRLEWKEIGFKVAFAKIMIW